jgi:hypothetical protein
MSGARRLSVNCSFSRGPMIGAANRWFMDQPSEGDVGRPLSEVGAECFVCLELRAVALDLLDHACIRHLAFLLPRRRLESECHSWTREGRVRFRRKSHRKTWMKCRRAHHRSIRRLKMGVRAAIAVASSGPPSVGSENVSHQWRRGPRRPHGTATRLTAEGQRLLGSLVQTRPGF